MHQWQFQIFLNFELKKHRILHLICFFVASSELGFCCLMPLSTIFQLDRWWSVLLVEETGVPEENHRPAASQCQTFLSHNVVSSTPYHE